MNRTTPAFVRWAPFLFAVLYMVGILLHAGTSPVDLLRYAAYVVFAVTLPGTLLYRSLRRNPFTLVEDLAMGAAVGLALELVAWAVFSLANIRGWVFLWPLLVYIPYLAVPKLRRHWIVRGYRTVPLGWSWTITGVVCFFTTYLAVVFLDRNPILPTSESTLMYLDLPYQLSLAGEATHRFPVGLPQVAGEPLYYHWFAYVHMGMTAMVGHIDLPVVALRLAIPALCAFTVLLTGVVAWRVSRRAYVGAIAAVLFFAVGEFNFTDPFQFLFGSQVTFVIWHGMSMIYSWALLVALIAPIAEIVRRSWPASSTVDSPPSSFVEDIPPVGATAAYVVATILLLASSGAKASSIPVVLAALLFTFVVLWIVNKRVPWSVLWIGLTTIGAQLFAVAVVFNFQTYGVTLGPVQGLKPYWADAHGWTWPLVVIGVWVAFLLNMEMRTFGVVPLLWKRRLRLGPEQWFLLGGGIAGPAIYLVFYQPSSGNQYFTRSGFAFAIILSAWGFAEVYERAKLSRRATIALAAFAAVFAGLTIIAQLAFAGPQPAGGDFTPLVSLLEWAAVLAAVGLVGGVAWWALGRTRPAMRGRGGIVLLTAILIAGAPGLIMDEVKSSRYPNGGAYAPISMPKSRVDAARFVRDHSRPTDVVATNVHCLQFFEDGTCDPREFWLSAYSERSVLVEGWGFAPRQSLQPSLWAPFWDPAKLQLNDEAFAAPTPQLLAQLRDQYDVHWLVVDRTTSTESPLLIQYATKVYDNGRMAVYELHDA
jgi:hypothetical protein